MRVKASWNATSACAVVVARGRQIHRCGQDAAGAKARIDALQRDETPEQKAGAGEEDERHGDLGDDERPKHLMQPPAPAVTSAVAQDLAGMFGRDQRRHDAKQESRHERHRRREQHERPIEPQLIEARDGNPIADERQQSTVAQDGDDKPCEAADGRQHEALGQQLTDQPDAARAERGAHAELPFAGGAACQQQAGHVDARDEQHQADGAHQGEQRGPHVADHLLLQRDHQHVAAGVPLGRIPFLLREDGAHFSRRLDRRTRRPAGAPARRRRRVRCRRAIARRSGQTG